MSCETSSRLVGRGPAQRNGIVGQTSRYLNTLGSWQSYRDLTSWEDLPGRVAQLTESFFGLKGLLGGQPKLAGLLGVILAVHASEQISGAVATMATRAFKRGKPLGQYRGIILREDPSAAKRDRLLNQVTGGRVRQPQGFYFFEGGRTWQSATVETQVGDTARTLTYLRSLSFPHREFFFDRSLEPQDQVELALGERDPDTLPGFIGSTNELENATVTLGQLKRLFFAANWLLIEPGEREGGPADQGGYGSWGRGPTGDQSGGGYPASRPPAAPSGQGPWPSPGYSRPSSTTIPVLRSNPTPSPIPRSVYGSYARAQPLTPSQVSDRLSIEGQERPVLVKRLVTSPLTQRRRADALYYDEDLRQWREVVDDTLRERLAEAVDDGLMQVTPPEQWPG